MGEITMPAELLAAVNIMGGGAAGAAGMQAVSEEGSAMFGSILSRLMSGGAENGVIPAGSSVIGGNAAEKSAPAAAIPEAAVPETAVPEAAVPVEDIPEAEDVSAEDVLLAAMDGDEKAELPKEFTPEGAEVFLKTLDRLLDGKCSLEDIGNLWKEIPDGEKASYVKLLETIFSGGGVKISSVNAKDDKKGSEGGAKDFLITLAELTAKAAAKSAKKSDKRSEDDPTGMTELLRSAFVTSIITVRTADAETVMTETAQTETVGAVGETVPAETAETVYVQEEYVQAEYIQAEPVRTDGAKVITDRSDKADVSVSVGTEISYEAAAETVRADVPAEKAQGAAESTVQDKTSDAGYELDEIVQSVYSKLYGTDSDKAEELCRVLADSLKAQISEGREDKDSIIETPVLESGRQAFMARVNRPGEMQIPAVREIVMPTAPQTAQTAEVQEVTAENADSEGADITVQIMERIDLYRDIADSGFTGREITMKLKPEELGGLEIKIRRSGGGLSISFAAERAEAAGLIAERAAQLAEAVASRGVKLREMYVSEQIVTEKGSSEFYGGSNPHSGNGAYEGASDRSGDSSGRRFTFGPEGMSEDNGSIDGTEDISAAGTAEYYNKEARLWVSA